MCSRRPGGQPPRRWPGRRSSCRSWPRPEWSTPGDRATCCCSTPSSPSSTAGPCRSTRPRPGRGPACSPPSTVTPVTARTGRRRPRAAGTAPALRGHVHARGARRTPCPPSRRSGPGSGTPSWWSAATGLWNCHIHTNDVGASIEAALDAGRPRNIRVTDLVEQVEEERWVARGRRGLGRRHGRRAAPDRRRGRPWWRWPTARESGGSSGPSACTTSWPAASR